MRIKTHLDDNIISDQSKTAINQESLSCHSNSEVYYLFVFASRAPPDR